MSMTIPLGLKTAIESGNCVLFVGAGIGYDMKDPFGNDVPDGNALTKEIADHFKIDTDSTDLAKVSQIATLRRSRAELDDFLRRRLANVEPKESVKWLATIRWKAIYTTNYDSGIERAYEHNPSPLQTPLSISATQQLIDFDTRFQVPIFHIHGALFGAYQNIVITQDDYTTFRERRRMLFERLKLQFATSTFLYIGYSHRDANWQLVWQELTSEFAPSKLPVSYRISPYNDPLDIELLRARGLETIECFFKDFALLARNELIASTVEPDELRQLAKSIPTDISHAFNNNPAAVIRLLSSWEYVNQAPFDANPNIEAFLHGDIPNWAILSGKHYFQRDIEEEVFDELLDYATLSPKGPASHVLVGPAGYGISTLLKCLAVRLVAEKVGPVFFHKNGYPVLEGDIEFATSLFQNKPIFIIDNAADSKHGISKAIQLLRDQKKAAMFLFGEQKNEWQQSKSRVSGKQFPVETLSDAEIHRLLDFLHRHHALNKLEPLSQEFRFIAVKKTHGKELLVAMREATEDLGFDAILENEYRGIAGEFSQRLYLTVACIYQYGTYVRDRILAEILDTSVDNMYAHIKDSTDGVVMFECISEIDMVYAARTRHKTIARIVWERCGDPSQKEEILQALISKVNLNYRVDAKVFENLVRNDHLIDSIRTLDGKTKFFEMACKKDPQSPYVRQHYARMLLREKKLVLALTQIEQAFAIYSGGSKPKILHHTKGMILSAMALDSEGFEVGRKYVARAEQAFRHSISLDAKDDYAYQGLAKLFLEWAKKSNAGEEESTKYIQKAEEVISQGLRVVRERDSLWIVSSEIANWLGDQEKRLIALERAVKEVPTSSVARYLLARQYRLAGFPEKATPILHPIVTSNPDDYRVVLEYALSVWQINGNLREAIALLSLSTTYGLGDPKFIATYGGMLFLNGQFTEANRIFEESVRREFSETDMNMVSFKPFGINTNEPLRVEGKVVNVHFRTTTIEKEGWPLLSCAISKTGNLILRKDMKVTVEIVFSAKGAEAVAPRSL